MQKSRLAWNYGVIEKYGRIDVLVNNAGQGGDYASIEEVAPYLLWKHTL